MQSRHAGILLLPLLVALGGCRSTRRGAGTSGSDPSAGRGVMESLPGQRQATTPAAQVTASRKKVNGKEEPATLIAIDKSTCAVTADKFKDTRIGDMVICTWSAGDRAP
jgi:hypothetical protein